jgi:hypothetical protein
MLSVLIADNQILMNRMLDPGVFLFGVLLVLFGMVLPMVVLLNKEPFLSRPIAGLLIIIECVLIGVLSLELMGTTGGHFTTDTFKQASTMFQTHRWMLFQIPLLLTAVAAGLLILYREAITEDHARDYRMVVVVSVFTGFASIIAIAFESLF